MKQHARFALCGLVFCCRSSATRAFRRRADAAPQPAPVESRSNPASLTPTSAIRRTPLISAEKFIPFPRGRIRFLLRVNITTSWRFPFGRKQIFPKTFPAEAEVVRDANGRVTAIIGGRRGREFTLSAPPTSRQRYARSVQTNRGDDSDCATG